LPEEQISPALHVAQALPPLPQPVVAFPGWHLSPWQHPAAQEVVVQVHLPALHSWEESQLTQALPAEPQFFWSVAMMHCPAAVQQPAQVVGVQVGFSHLPALHTWSLPQGLHCAPPMPQLTSVRLVMQLPLWSQQPLAQVLALQACLTQLCCLHCWPAPQSWQLEPPLPQAPGLVPGRQAP